MTDSLPAPDRVASFFTCKWRGADGVLPLMDATDRVGSVRVRRGQLNIFQIYFAFIHGRLPILNDDESPASEQMWSPEQE